MNFGMIILATSLLVFGAAVIKIALLKEHLFAYLKFLIILGLIGIIAKILAIDFGLLILTRLYLAITLLVAILMVLQLNRVSLRSLQLNLVMSVVYVAALLEIFMVPDTMIDPEYTVLPVRNSAMLIAGIIMASLSVLAVSRIRKLKRRFGKLIVWEERNAYILLLFSIIATLIFGVFLISYFYGVTKLFIILNYFFILVIALMLLSLSITISTNPFFVSFTGIEGIAVVFGGVTLTSIGEVPNSLILGLEKMMFNSLRVISKDKILIYWRTTVSLGGERRKLSLLMLGRYLEKNGELFFTLLSSRIRDRLTRDYLLTKKLMDIDYFVRQIESPLPPRFLREEFKYTIQAFRRLL